MTILLDVLIAIAAAIAIVAGLIATLGWLVSTPPYRGPVTDHFDRQLGARTAVATHFGTFRLADDAEMEAPERIAAAELASFWVLGFGEGRNVPL